jgi:hypothetical protein
MRMRMPTLNARMRMQQVAAWQPPLSPKPNARTHAHAYAHTKRTHAHATGGSVAAAYIADRVRAGGGVEETGTQLTCFTSTKVQMLTGTNRRSLRGAAELLI